MENDLLSGRWLGSIVALARLGVLGCGLCRWSRLRGHARGVRGARSRGCGRWSRGTRVGGGRSAERLGSDSIEESLQDCVDGRTDAVVCVVDDCHGGRQGVSVAIRDAAELGDIFRDGGS